MEKNQETLIRAFVRAGIAAFEAMADDGPDRSRVHEYAEVRQTLYDDPIFHAALEDPNFVEACHYTLEETAALLRRSDNVRGIAPKLHSLAGFLTFLFPKPDLDDKVVVLSDPDEDPVEAAALRRLAHEAWEQFRRKKLN